MERNEFTEFSQLMIGIAELYGKPLSEFALSIYWNVLAHHSLPAVRDALSRCVSNPDTGQFMPKPADIIRMLAGSTQDAAFAAWSKVDKAVRQIGPYQTVVFDDPIIHRVIADMGGWIDFGNCDEEKEWPFRAREFQNRYRGFAAHGTPMEHPRQLVGISDAENARNGYAERSDLILIGDASKAQAVLESGSDRPALAITPLSRLLDEQTKKYLPSI